MQNCKKYEHYFILLTEQEKQEVSKLIRSKQSSVANNCKENSKKFFNYIKKKESKSHSAVTDLNYTTEDDTEMTACTDSLT